MNLIRIIIDHVRFTLMYFAFTSIIYRLSFEKERSPEDYHADD